MSSPPATALRPRPASVALVCGAVLAAIGLGGCGGTSAASRAVGVTQVPLAAGSQIAARVRSCDRGANAYCSEQLIVTGPSYPDSFALLVSERRRLRQLGWSSHQGSTGKEVAEESPGSELRMTYATAYNDLLAIDSGWIRRTAALGHALSHVLFARTPAISVLLQRGPS